MNEENSACRGSWLFAAAAVVIPADAQTLKQLPEGVALGHVHAVAQGATLLSVLREPSAVGRAELGRCVRRTGRP